MATRRDAREWAVQLLFQLDVNPQEPTDALPHFWKGKRTDKGTRAFTESLVRGVRENLDRVDASIRKYAQHWDVGRMAIVDRNILRMAIYEMMFRPDIPPVVTINEAVDLAKYFSSMESGRFVNGILDRFRADLSRPARTPGEAEADGDADA